MSSSPSTATATIPVIDVSPWTTTGRHPDDDDDDRRAAVVSRVAAACRDVGFFAVTGHGLHDDDDDDEGVLGDALEASREFFDLPPERKLLARSDDPVTYPYGYENAERLARGKKSERYDDDDDAVTTADLKETWSMGPVGGDDDGSGAVPARRWPPEASPPTMASALTRYYDAMEKLSSTLLRILATALELSTSDWFADRRRDRHVSALRILHYFALEEDDDDGEGRRHGRGRRIRAGAHTDYGPLTVLYSGGPGLQVRIHHHNGDDDDDAWMDVPDLPGAFIVNLGDLMQRWTNGESPFVQNCLFYAAPCVSETGDD